MVENVMARYESREGSSNELVQAGLSTIGNIVSVNSGLYYRIGDARWSAALDVSSDEAIEEFAELTQRAEESGGAVMAAIEDGDDEVGNGAFVNSGVGSGASSFHVLDGRYVLCEPPVGAYSEEGVPNTDALLLREIHRPLGDDRVRAVVDVPSGLLSISDLWADSDAVEAARTQLETFRAKKYVEIGADSEGYVIAVEPGKYSLYVRKVRTSEEEARIVLVAPTVR